MLNGENSILNRAGRARDITGQKDIEERIQLAYLKATSTGIRNTTKGDFENELKKEFGEDIVKDLADDLSKVKINEKEYETGISDAGSSGLTQQADGTFIDSSNNEWVWIEVPKSVTQSANTDDEIYEALRDYCNPVIAKTGSGVKTTTRGWTDEWYAWDTTNNVAITESTENLTDEQRALTNGCGLSLSEYNSTKHTMLNSIKNNGGFYIGKYETGIDDPNVESTATTKAGLRTSSGDTTQTAVIKQNMQPYSYITCSQAEILAKGLRTDGKTASLLFGIQWDLVLKFINVKENLGDDNTILTADSTTWGNYVNNSSTKGTFTITSEYAMSSSDNGENFSAIAKDTVKSGKRLLTTGSSTGLSKQNIYDFAGNLFEWTLEKTSDANSPCSYRGGVYYYDGANLPASCRYASNPVISNGNYTFRVALY